MDNKHHASKPKTKNKLFMLLPRAMSFGQHHVPPFSPGRDLHHNHNHHHHNMTTSFSGPMVPLVPKAARVRRNKHEDVWNEPTSPKVSCIGQIKRVKSKRCSPKKNKALLPKNPKASSSSLTKEDEKGHLSKIKRLFSFSTGGNTSRKSHPTAVDHRPVVVVSAAAVPSLGHMKKFASSRDALGGFDWRVDMKNEEGEEFPADHRRGYYSDDDKRGEYEDDEDDIMVPFSAPLSLKPKKEVNLWKRRTMDPPKQLHL